MGQNISYNNKSFIIINNFFKYEIKFIYFVSRNTLKRNIALKKLRYAESRKKKKEAKF